jgi:tocopherol O-methyltransferase
MWSNQGKIKIDKHNSAIVDYYDNVQFLYDHVWSKKGMHYGIWYEDTRNRSQAVENTDRLVSQLLEVQSDDFILDAGCGIGESSFFMARKFGAEVIGISISSKQTQQAEKNACKRDLSHLVSFNNMDFNETRFDNSFFDKIFGIESICYAPDKRIFLEEAYRTLKPEGRIVIVDGFLLRTNFDAREEKIYRGFLKGWALPGLSTKEHFRLNLSKTGFKHIRYYDKRNEVLPSSQQIYRIAFFTFPILVLLVLVRLFHKETLGNSISMIRQKAMFDRGMLTYGAFTAEK